jgi:hypothetical protein
MKQSKRIPLWVWLTIDLIGLGLLWLHFAANSMLERT